MSSNSDQEPGLISGHARYAKGATVETIGSVTGSEEWRTSGAAEKAAGEEEMKEAARNRDQEGTGGGFGKVEELAGKAVGCEGMEKEGAESKQQ